VQALAITHRFSTAAPVVTVSIGVASSLPDRHDDSGFVTLLKYADDALYQAKADGRNRSSLSVCGEIVASSA
jgi:diguanylate cyclase (GGDEF)-like protein